MNLQEIMHELAHVHRFFKSIFNHFDIVHLNVPINKTQERVLMFIKRHEASNMSEISKMTGLEKGSFTTTADHLIKIGLIERRRSETDRRTIALTLTEKGHQMAEEIIKALDKHIEERLDVLDEKEKDEFVSALQVVSKYIDKMEQKRGLKNG